MFLIRGKTVKKVLFFFLFLKKNPRGETGTFSADSAALY